MFSVVIIDKGGTQRRVSFEKSEITIGRVQGNDIILPKGNVSKRHSRIVLKDRRFIVVDLKSTNGTYVNGRRITSPLVIRAGDKVYVGDFIITVDPLEEAQQPPVPPAMPGKSVDERSEPPASSRSTRVSSDPPPLPGSRASSLPPDASDDDASGPRITSDHSAEDGMPSSPPDGTASRSSRPSSESPSSRLQQQIREAEKASVPPAHPQRASDAESHSEARATASLPPHKPVSPHTSNAAASDPPASDRPSAPHPQQSQGAPSAGDASTYDADVRRAGNDPRPLASPAIDVSDVARGEGAAQGLASPGSQHLGPLPWIMHRLGQSMDVHRVDAQIDDPESVSKARVLAAGVVEELVRAGHVDPGQQEILSMAAVNEALGLGALEPFIGNQAVLEVTVQPGGAVMVDRGEGLTLSTASFTSRAAVWTAVKRLLARVGERLDPQRLTYELRLPQGEQVTVLLPPLAVGGPVLELRRGGAPKGLTELAAMGCLTGPVAELLETAVHERKNIAVVGLLGSGVTTLLEALAASLDGEERVVLVEDRADLRVAAGHVTTLSTVTGHGPIPSVNLADVIAHAARLRADRIIVDGMRGSEAFDAIALMCARPSGNLLGFHAPTDKDPTLPIRTLARIGWRGEESTISEIVSRALHLIVHVVKTPEGFRVESVFEISGMKGSKILSNRLVDGASGEGVAS